MENVRQLLDDKGDQVFTIRASDSVWDAIRLMNDNHIGALVVVRGGTVCGMFTERDVLRRVVGERRSPEHTAVSDVMTDNVLACALDTPLNVVRSLMMNRRVRHIPVVNESGALLGLVSIGDLNAWSIEKKDAEIVYMESYIHGRA